MPATTRARARSAVPLRLGIEPPDRIVEAARSRGVVLPEVYYGQMRGLARQLSFSIAGVSALDQLQLVKESLDRAMATGEGFRDWKRRALRGEIPLALPPHRLETIFRTNIQGNYARGAGEWQARNAGTHPFLLYDAVNDTRTRPTHRTMDGTILPVAHSWWRTHYPPNGYNCRCRAIPLTESQARRQGGALDNPPPLAAGTEPDPGFAYDPRANPKSGAFEAIRRARRRAVPQLKPKADALERALAEPLRVATVDEALALGRDRLAALVAKVDGRSDAGLMTPPARALYIIAEVRAEVARVHGAHKGATAFKARDPRAWSAWYPKSWVEAADAAGPLKVRSSKTRARYRPGLRYQSGEWFRAPDLTYSTASVFVHEYGHHLQAMLPDLDALFQDYVRRRIGPNPGPAQRLAVLFPRHGYRGDEVAHPDGFWHAYVGKLYGRRGYLEAASMLPQALLADPFELARILEVDRETAEFALGVLLGWRP